MNRLSAFLICTFLFAALFSGCGAESDENITFTAVIEELYDNSILVSTSDDVGFDKASVGIGGLRIGFDLTVGQTVKITILPEIRESYPVQVTATAIELVAPASNEIEGVSMTVEDGTVTPTGLTLFIRDTNDEPYTYGQWYELQKKTDDQWTALPVVVEGDYGFTDEGLLPDKDGILKLDVDWEWLYGKLEPGEYRIVKSVYIHPDENKYFSAEFKIA